MKPWQLSDSIGNTSVIVQRGLRNLQLMRFELDGVAQINREEVLQARIAELVGVWSFSDWLLLLRLVMFYFEDRRALVWDPTAQVQLLRFLFRPPEVARRWNEEERAVLELDSRARNLSASIYREENALVSSEALVAAAPDVRAELASLEDLQGIDTVRREELSAELLELSSFRHCPTSVHACRAGKGAAK